MNIQDQSVPTRREVAYLGDPSKTPGVSKPNSVAAKPLSRASLTKFDATQLSGLSAKERAVKMSNAKFKKQVLEPVTYATPTAKKKPIYEDRYGIEAAKNYNPIAEPEVFEDKGIADKAVEIAQEAGSQILAIPGQLGGFFSKANTRLQKRSDEFNEGKNRSLGERAGFLAGEIKEGIDSFAKGAVKGAGRFSSSLATGAGEAGSKFLGASYAGVSSALDTVGLDSASRKVKEMSENFKTLDDKFDDIQEKVNTDFSPVTNNAAENIGVFVGKDVLPFALGEGAVHATAKAISPAFKAFDSASPILSRAVSATVSDIGLTTAVFGAENQENQTQKQFISNVLFAAVGSGAGAGLELVAKLKRGGFTTEKIEQFIENPPSTRAKQREQAQIEAEELIRQESIIIEAKKQEISTLTKKERTKAIAENKLRLEESPVKPSNGTITKAESNLATSNSDTPNLELVRATRQIADQVAQGEIPVSAIDGYVKQLEPREQAFAREAAEERVAELVLDELDGRPNNALELIEANKIKENARQAELQEDINQLRADLKEYNKAIDEAKAEPSTDLSVIEDLETMRDESNKLVLSKSQSLEKSRNRVLDQLSKEEALRSILAAHRGNLPKVQRIDNVIQEINEGRIPRQDVLDSTELYNKTELKRIAKETRELDLLEDAVSPESLKEDFEAMKEEIYKENIKALDEKTIKAIEKDKEAIYSQAVKERVNSELAEDINAPVSPETTQYLEENGVELSKEQTIAFERLKGAFDSIWKDIQEAAKDAGYDLPEGKNDYFKFSSTKAMNEAIESQDAVFQLDSIIEDSNTLKGRKEAFDANDFNKDPIEVFRIGIEEQAELLAALRAKKKVSDFYSSNHVKTHIVAETELGAKYSQEIKNLKDSFLGKSLYKDLIYDPATFSARDAITEQRATLRNSDRRTSIASSDAARQDGYVEGASNSFGKGAITQGLYIPSQLAAIKVNQLTALASKTIKGHIKKSGISNNRKGSIWVEEHLRKMPLDDFISKSVDDIASELSIPTNKAQGLKDIAGRTKESIDILGSEGKELIQKEIKTATWYRGEEGFLPKLDALEQARAYKEAFSDYVEHAEHLIKHLKTVGKGNIAKSWERRIKEGVKNGISEIDVIPLGSRKTFRYKSLRKLNKAATTAGLKLNVLWTVFVQPLSLPSRTVAVVGLPNTFYGVMDYLNNPALRKWSQDTNTLRLKAGAESQGNVLDAGFEETGKLGLGATKLQKVDAGINVVSGFIAGHMEKFLHGSSALAGRRKAIKAGWDDESIKNYADHVGVVTQGDYTNIGRASVSRSVALSGMARFQSYATLVFDQTLRNMGEDFWTSIKNEKDFHATKSANAKIALNTMLGSYIASEYYKAVSGSDEGKNSASAFIPYVGGFVEDVMETYKEGRIQSNPNGFVGGTLKMSQALGKGIQDDKWEDFNMLMLRNAYAMGGLPAWNITNRAIKTAQIEMAEGEVRNNAEQLQYVEDAGIFELFYKGSYNTDQAKLKRKRDEDTTEENKIINKLKEEQDLAKEAGDNQTYSIKKREIKRLKKEQNDRKAAVNKELGLPKK